MKKVFMLFLFNTFLVFAQTGDLQNMIKHEYAFAEKAAKSSTRDAFIAFIADEGIMFRPHPVNGKEFMEKSKPNGGWLIWYPERASISLSGDIGYTTGPASYRKEKGDSNDIWFGNYLSVWRKQKDNSWKFLIDYGISNLKPVTRINKLAINHNELINYYPLTELGDRNNIKMLEDNFSKLNFDLRNKKYFSGSRLLIEGLYPIDGETSIVNFLSGKVKDNLKYNFLDGEISSTNDFAYSYGTVKYYDLTNNVEKEEYFMRVWQKQKSDWKITVELWNEKPKD